jgi:hypothetical protein
MDNACRMKMTVLDIPVGDLERDQERFSRDLSQGFSDSESPLSNAK